MSGTIIHNPEDPLGGLVGRVGLEHWSFHPPRSRSRRRPTAVLPNALIQVNDAVGLGSKVGIALEKPASMLPRAQRIAAEPNATR